LTSSNGAPSAQIDVGLLSPVRAGSAAEQATGDGAYLRAVLEAEAALARACARAGLIPHSAARAVTDAAAGAFDAADLACRARESGNPVIPLVADLTAAVARLDGEAASCVHLGATSQDILDTATMLICRRVLELIRAELDHSINTLTRLADTHRATIMAARTLTQQAVPTSFGLKAAGWRSQLVAARARVMQLAARLPVQLGGAAGTMAAFVAWSPRQQDEGALLLQAAFAAETGLVEPILPWHTLRAPIADLAAVLAFTAGALGKIAADVLVLSRSEIAELTEGAPGGSSAMPHKRNPVRAVLIAAAARRLPALAAQLFGSLVAEDERAAGVWHGEWEPLREALRLTAGAAEHCAAMLETLHVDPERMRTNLRPEVTAEHVAIGLAARLGRSRAAAIAARHHTSDELRALPELAGVPASVLERLTDPDTYVGAAEALIDRALREGG
jgi:3-carboxy-cis,cis-muconate cycloisomerase